MTTDVVCVLDASLTQVFEAARAVKATVTRDSKSMEHPLETGATVTDHRVILPTEIELSLVLSSADYKGVYRQIANLFTKGDLLTVQTRADTYRNMVIQKIPHEENPDVFDALNLAMTLKEVLYVDAQFSDLKVSRPRDSKTKHRGEQQPKDTGGTAKQSSILSRLFK